MPKDFIFSVLSLDIYWDDNRHILPNNWKLYMDLSLVPLESGILAFINELMKDLLLSSRFNNLLLIDAVDLSFLEILLILSNWKHLLIKSIFSIFINLVMTKPSSNRNAVNTVSIASNFTLSIYLIGLNSFSFSILFGNFLSGVQGVTVETRFSGKFIYKPKRNRVASRNNYLGFSIWKDIVPDLEKSSISGIANYCSRKQ